MFQKILLAGVVSAAVLIGSSPSPASVQTVLLNASYDVARELFNAVNPKFAAHWKQETDEALTIDPSFAGSSRQAQDIIRGKKADVVTFNQASDINILLKNGLVLQDWTSRFPDKASPYYSTIAFLVRKGNPKNIKDWSDLARDDVKLIFANPKTSGNACYSYLAVWLYASERYKGDEK